MRTFLHKLMVDITRHPREVIAPVMSSSSIVVNVFRIYEYWFGRRAGIRPDGALDGNGRQLSYSWENLLAVYEGLIRVWLSGKIPKFSIVYLSKLEIIGGMRMGISPFRFAIAFDNSNGTNTGQGVGTTMSLSYTCTGSSRYLFGFFVQGSGTANHFSSMTYNSVSMTEDNDSSGDGVHTGFACGTYLAGPTSGSNTLLVTSSVSGGVGSLTAASYTGVNQTAPDTVSAAQVVSGVTSVTQTFTTSTANCWAMLFLYGSNGTLTAGTNTTFRFSPPGGVGGAQPYSADSNGIITTGGFNMTITALQSGQGYGVVGWTFTQGVAPTINSGFFFAADK